VSALVTFRVAQVEDLEAIDRVELASFEGPWQSAIYEEELRRENSTVEVAVKTVEADSVVGVSCSWVVADECHLLRVLTDPAMRGRGIGRELVQRIIQRATDAKCESVTLEVASRNDAAIGLYASVGFVEVGRRPGYYKLPPDDAVLMTLEL